MGALESVTQAIKDAVSTKLTNKGAIIKASLSSIVFAKNSGFKHTEIVGAINEGGLKITVNYYKTVLFRLKNDAVKIAEDQIIEAPQLKDSVDTVDIIRASEEDQFEPQPNETPSQTIKRLNKKAEFLRKRNKS